jgi:hypothetical protein
MQTLRHVFLLSAMGLGLPTMSASAQTAVNATTVETDPKVESVLHANEPLSIRITYHSDVPLRFQAAGYSSGVEILKSVAMNTAPSYPAGSGEAIAWLSYGGETNIDEIRIKISDKHWKQLDTLSVRITMKWNGITPRAWRERAPWVTQLDSVHQRMTSQAIQASASGNADGFDMLDVLIPLMGWNIPLYFFLQIYMLKKYQGAWRKAALAPLLVMAPLFAYTVMALLAGSNLWPLMILFITPVLSLYLIGVLICRFFLHHAQAQVHGRK